MAFVSHTAKQWLAGHRKGISICVQYHTPPPSYPPSICLCLSSSFLSIPFLPLLLFPLFLSLLLGRDFFCVWWVWRRWGLLFAVSFKRSADNAPSWVWTPHHYGTLLMGSVKTLLFLSFTPLSLLFHLLSFLLPPSFLRWLTHKDPLMLFFSPCSQFMGSSEAANKPKHTSITAQLHRQPIFSLLPQQASLLTRIKTTRRLKLTNSLRCFFFPLL